MISDLRMKSGAHWKKIVEKYGSGEKGTVLDFKDFLQGRQAASVTLHGCSVNFRYTDRILLNLFMLMKDVSSQRSMARNWCRKKGIFCL